MLGRMKHLAFALLIALPAVAAPLPPLVHVEVGVEGVQQRWLGFAGEAMRPAHGLAPIADLQLVPQFVNGAFELKARCGESGATLTWTDAEAQRTQLGACGEIVFAPRVVLEPGGLRSFAGGQSRLRDATLADALFELRQQVGLSVRTTLPLDTPVAFERSFVMEEWLPALAAMAGGEVALRDGVAWIVAPGQEPTDAPRPAVDAFQVGFRVVLIDADAVERLPLRRIGGGNPLMLDRGSGEMDLDLALVALEQQGRATTVSRPIIVARAGERATITSGCEGSSLEIAMTATMSDLGPVVSYSVRGEGRRAFGLSGHASWCGSAWAMLAGGPNPRTSALVFVTVAPTRV